MNVLMGNRPIRCLQVPFSKIPLVSKSITEIQVTAIQK